MFKLKVIVAFELKVASVISILNNGNISPLFKSISAPVVIVLTNTSCSAKLLIYLNSLLYAFIL